MQLLDDLVDVVLAKTLEMKRQDSQADHDVGLCKLGRRAGHVLANEGDGQLEPRFGDERVFSDDGLDFLLRHQAERHAKDLAHAKRQEDVQPVAREVEDLPLRTRLQIERLRVLVSEILSDLVVRNVGRHAHLLVLHVQHHPIREDGEHALSVECGIQQDCMRPPLERIAGVAFGDDQVQLAQELVRLRIVAEGRRRHLVLGAEERVPQMHGQLPAPAVRLLRKVERAAYADGKVELRLHRMAHPIEFVHDENRPLHQPQQLPPRARVVDEQVARSRREHLRAILGLPLLLLPPRLCAQIAVVPQLDQILEKLEQHRLDGRRRRDDDTVVLARVVHHLEVARLGHRRTAARERIHAL